MVVADGAVHGALHVEGTVALGLVATLVLTVEDVEVVAPDMFVVCIETDTVLGMHHDGKVAQLNISAVTCQHTKAMESGIVADTLNGQIHVLALTLHLEAYGGTSQFGHVGLLQLSDDSHGQRTCLNTLLVGLKNILNTRTSFLVIAYLHTQSDGFGVILRHIDDAGARFQRAIIVVGSDTFADVIVGIAVTIVVTDFQIGCLVLLCGQFRTISTDGYHFNNIRPCFQTHYIGTSVATVVAHQLGVNLGKVSILSTFHIDVVRLGTLQQSELHVGRLQPAISLKNLYIAGIGEQRQTRKHS